MNINCSLSRIAATGFYALCTTSLSIAADQQPGQPIIVSDIGEIQPADATKFYKEPGYSPYAGKHFPERPLFGDEHVHTGWSVDAGMSGATLSPADAVRFARGEEVTATSGQPVRLSRPLDWVAVTDHSDGMGTIAGIREGNPDMMRDATLKRWHDMMLKGPEESAKATLELVAAQSNKRLPPAITDPKYAKSYCLHRVRVDLQCGWRRQPASQRHLSGRQEDGGLSPADDDVPE
jgi:hypothetical protein